jgi:hypothetical protein
MWSPSTTCSTPWLALYTLSWVSSRIRLMVWSNPCEKSVAKDDDQTVHLEGAHEVPAVGGDHADRPVDITLQGAGHPLALVLLL